ncbi:MAG: aldo/keto reductase [Candidatus Binatia bacterium]|nr:MAG: aldo/keto reductase [Candidatus Binatia bacterium]
MELLTVRSDSRPIGPTSLRVFPIAYGCWRFGRSTVREAREKIEAAVEVGVQLFDHADVYYGGQAEELFGKVLEEAPALRSKIVIATKCGVVPGLPYKATRDHIIRSAEQSLRRLRCEIIDLFFIHRPDLLTHPAETAGALEVLRAQGKIREAGVSNYSPAQCAALQRFLPFPLAAHQREWSCIWPVVLTDGTVEQCYSAGMGLLGWSPLAGGKLMLPLREAEKQRNAAVLVPTIRKLDELAAAQGVGRAAVALAFLLAHPVGAIPIVGTQQVKRIRCLGEVFRVELSRADWYALFQCGAGKTLP